LPDDAITTLVEDHAGTLWIVAGVYLSRYRDGKFTNLAPGPDLPVTALRTVHEDWHGDLWIGGYGGVGKLVDGKFLPVVDTAGLKGNIVTSMLVDRRELKDRIALSLKLLAGEGGHGAG